MNQSSSSLYLNVTSIPENKRHLGFKNDLYVNQKNYNFISSVAQIHDVLFNVDVDNELSDSSIMMNGFYRTIYCIKLNEIILVTKPKINLNKVIQQMTVKINYYNMNHQHLDKKNNYACEDFDKMFMKCLNNYILDLSNKYIICSKENEDIKFTVEIESINVVNMDLIGNSKKEGFIIEPSTYGMFISGTTEIIYDSTTQLTSKLGKRSNASIFRHSNINYENLKIGGIDEKFNELFRRAFASRILHPNLVKKFDIKHQKGIILYGPPGCGKTLLARSLCKILNTREPKIVNGPDILNKYVGQSEENIRKLFLEAETEYASKGDESELHVIIFDEIDSICRHRGSSESLGTNVGNTIVNQLLTKMDGINSLNNILIFGMTNRLDMIDEALLRPGRFGIHLEITLPNEIGRYQIFQIHTSKLRDGNLIDQNVDFNYLAKNTKNFTGAEIEAVIQDAQSYLISRQIDLDKLTTNIEKMEGQITTSDFELALQKIKPKFGSIEEDFVCLNDIVSYGKKYDNIMRELNNSFQQLSQSKYLNLMTILLTGNVGTGKTTIVSKIATMNPQFPFCRFISSDKLLQLSELDKCAKISNIFMDSYKSQLSYIILDNIERLIEYIPIGPRFSSAVLQTILVLLSKRPPTINSKLMVIVTSSNLDLLKRLDMMNLFNNHIHIDNLNQNDISHFLKEYNQSDQVIDDLSEEGITIRDLLLKLS